MKRIKYWLFFVLVLLLVSCSNQKKEVPAESKDSSITVNSNYWRFAVPITLKFLQ